MSIISTSQFPFSLFASIPATSDITLTILDVFAALSNGIYFEPVIISSTSSAEKAVVPQIKAFSFSMQASKTSIDNSLVEKSTTTSASSMAFLISSTTITPDSIPALETKPASLPM